MKKVITGLAIYMILMQGFVSAQVTLPDELISSVKLKEGPNSIQLPGQNTLSFNYDRNTFSTIVLLDSSGISHRLRTWSKTVNDAPPVSCESTQVKETYASVNKNIGACICKPAPSSSGELIEEFRIVVDIRRHFPIGKAQNRRVEIKLSK